MGETLTQIFDRKGLRYIAFFLLLCAIVINIGFVLATADKLLDFGSFIAASQNARTGINPYDDTSPLIFQTEYEELGIGGKLPNLNPPISVLLFWPLSYLDPLLGVTIWRFVSIGLYIVAAIMLWRTSAVKSGLVLLWSLSLAGFWHTIQLGQIYVLLFCALVLIHIFNKRDNFILAGALIGFIAAIKPNFLVWIFLLGVVGNWKLTFPALISFGVLSVLPIVVFGPEIYLQWSGASSLDSRILGMPGNNSLPGLTTRMGSYQVGFILGVVLLVGYGIVLFRNRQKIKEETVHDLGILLSLLISPISWTGYTILLVPTFINKMKWKMTTLLSAVVLAVPFIIPLFLFDNSQLNFVFWGWFYGWGILLLLGEISNRLLAKVN